MLSCCDTNTLYHVTHPPAVAHTHLVTYRAPVLATHASNTLTPHTVATLVPRTWQHTRWHHTPAMAPHCAGVGMPHPRSPWLVVGLLWPIAVLNYLDRVMITSMRQSLTDAIPMSASKPHIVRSCPFVKITSNTVMHVGSTLYRAPARGRCWVQNTSRPQG